LRRDGDAGFTSRDPDYDGPLDAQVEYELSNGQRDFYPRSWALPLDVPQRAIHYFEQEKKRPPFVIWHDDAGD
jgi:hypothetical protein